MRPQVRRNRLVLTLAVLWLALVFGSFFALSIRHQVGPKLVSLLGG